MQKEDIILLQKLLRKKGRNDLSNLLNNSYSSLNESTTYGSRSYSVLTTFEIYSPTDEYLKLSTLEVKDGQEILDCVKIIYPLKNDAPEIVNVEFLIDSKIDIVVKENHIKLKRPEIFRIVNDYIGVKDGYLGNFSYNSHAEFYPYYCDLEIDPTKYQGTTKERFINILESSDIPTQAKILKGILKKVSIEGFEVSERSQKQKVKDEIIRYINRLEENSTLESPILVVTNETVERAINDAKMLMNESGATSGVDRIHTALHGYLKQICLDSGISINENSSITDIYKKLRSEHPKLVAKIHRQNDIDKILKSLANIIDVLNPIRNKGTMAHPNEELLLEDEAKLVINATHTILHYLNSKLT